MYNRYIPQPDGSYRRNRMQEIVQRPEKPAPPPPPPLPPPSKEPALSPCSNCVHNPPPRRPTPREPCRREGSSVSGFLKQLLPSNFEVEDLLVVLLLLLMAGDSQENQNSAILTLVLYLFL